MPKLLYFVHSQSFTSATVAYLTLFSTVISTEGQLSTSNFGSLEASLAMYLHVYLFITLIRNDSLLANHAANPPYSAL